MLSDFAKEMLRPGVELSILLIVLRMRYSIISHTKKLGNVLEYKAFVLDLRTPLQGFHRSTRCYEHGSQALLS